MSAGAGSIGDSWIPGQARDDSRIVIDRIKATDDSRIVIDRVKAADDSRIVIDRVKATDDSRIVIADLIRNPWIPGHACPELVALGGSL